MLARLGIRDQEAVEKMKCAPALFSMRVLIYSPRVGACWLLLRVGEQLHVAYR